MKPVIDHIQITVKDMAVAVPFYDRMLPILGFDVSGRVRATVEKHELDVVEYIHPVLTFAISSPRRSHFGESIHRRRPGSLHHLAFRATTKAEVDRIHFELKAIDVEIVGGPRLWPEHGPDYYAVFFKDLEGLKYEIVCSSDTVPS